jgi:glutaredoxin 3
MGVDFEAVELDKLEDGHLIQIELYTLSGQRSVPNVFIGGNHLGGNDDTQAAARSGKLQKLLEES